MVDETVGHKRNRVFTSSRWDYISIHSCQQLLRPKLKTQRSQYQETGHTDHSARIHARPPHQIQPKPPNRHMTYAYNSPSHGDFRLTRRRYQEQPRSSHHLACPSLAASSLLLAKSSRCRQMDQHQRPHGPATGTPIRICRSCASWQPASSCSSCHWALRRENCRTRQLPSCRGPFSSRDCPPS